MKKIFFLSITFCTIIFIVGFSNRQHENVPPSGYVPDEKTAIIIAETILSRVYGGKILNERPFTAHLSDDSLVWKVRGSLKKGMKGGVVQILIQKKDCKILNITHGK